MKTNDFNKLREFLWFANFKLICDKIFWKGELGKMTSTEILNEISNLPESERQKVINSLTEKEESIDLRLQKSLYEDGLLREIRTTKSNKVAEFKPIKIEGEPLSETIIRERR